MVIRLLAPISPPGFMVSSGSVAVTAVKALSVLISVYLSALFVWRLFIVPCSAAGGGPAGSRAELVERHDLHQGNSSRMSR